MADEQFSLGDALGSYEKAQADREFYLSMVQGGKTAASPIAAYLAGVAGVKMGQMRSEAQQLKDAEEATQRAIKRGDTLRNNLFQLAESARKGDIAPGSAATLAGAIVKEMGYTPREFDTDNMILTYSKDGDDYELDLSQGTNPLEAGRNLRAGQRIEWEREKQQRGIQAKKEMQGGGYGKKEQYTTLSNFNSTHKSTNEALNAKIGRQRKMNKLTQTQVKDYIDGAEKLSPSDRKQVQAKVDELLKLAQDRGWNLSSTIQAVPTRYADMSDEEFLNSMPR